MNDNLLHDTNNKLKIDRALTSEWGTWVWSLRETYTRLAAAKCESVDVHPYHMWPLLVLGMRLIRVTCEQRRKKATNLSVCFVVRILLFLRCGVNNRQSKGSMSSFVVPWTRLQHRTHLQIPVTTTIPFRKEHTHWGANQRRHMKLEIERAHYGLTTLASKKEGQLDDTDLFKLHSNSTVESCHLVELFWEKGSWHATTK